jgi:hypothetical protein
MVSTRNTAISMNTPIPGEHVILRHGERHSCVQDLLGPYLRQHPARKAELLRLLPEAVHGVCGCWRLKNGSLFLDELYLMHDAEPFTDMVLWQALFPGLRAPLRAWWCSGSLIIGTGTHPGAPIAPGNTVYLERGHGTTAASSRWWHRDFHQWPLFWRILLLPVSMVLAPVAWLMALWELRRSLPLPVLFVLGLFAPVAVMFVPFVVMGPRRYVDPFMAFVQRWTVPFFEGAEQEQAVSDLLSDALGREPRRRV